MDKNQTKELILSLKLILIGIVFWIIRYFLFFLIKQDSIFNAVRVEIIGTILIIVALTIIQRIYPFAHTILALILTYLLLAANILHIFLYLYKNEYYRIFNWYMLFALSIILILISKIVESGLRYFKNRELSHKWRYLIFIIFFGISIPLYFFISLYLCDIISFNKIIINTKTILIFLPLVITVIIVILYYLIVLIKSFNFLSKIQNNTK